MEPAAHPVLPDLDGASVAGIVPALLGAADRSWLPAPAQEARAVVLLVLDGLGWNALQEHAALAPTLHAMTGRRITTVVPATTSTALTSICTGLAPAQHGILGYRMLVNDRVLNVLRWTMPDAKRVPDPFEVQRHAAFLGREVPAVTKAEFRKSGFTQAHLRGAKFVGWSTPSVLIEHISRLVSSDERFVYAYYPGVDTVAHEFGLYNGFYESEIAYTDRLVGDILTVLPSDVALLVTADHGQVHTDADDWIGLDALRGYVRAMAGDGRFRHLHAVKGATAELAEAAADLLGTRAWVRTRAQILDEQWLGRGATGTVPGRLGDVVLAARDRSAFVDPTLPVETRLRSSHGSLTPDEMYVPLLAAFGTARS